MLFILDELSQADGFKSMTLRFLLPVLYYTYVAPVLPGFCYDELQRKISAVVDALEDRRPLPSYIDVPAMFRGDMIRILKEWQSDAIKKYPTKKVREAAVSQQGDWANTGLVPDGCRKESAFYLELAFL